MLFVAEYEISWPTLDAAIAKRLEWDEFEAVKRRCPSCEEVGAQLNTRLDLRRGHEEVLGVDIHGVTANLDRIEDKTIEKYKEVLALDPEGKAGSFTDADDTKITAPYTDFARYELAAASFQTRRRDPAPLRAFIDAYPASPLVRQAYRTLGSYYVSSASKEDAAKLFAEFAGRYPGDPEPLSLWLRRIVRDKGPVDKGLEIAAQLRAATRMTPNPSARLSSGSRSATMAW